AEAGERRDPAAEVGSVGGLGPDACGVTAVVALDDLAELLHSARHRAREAVQRRLAAEDLFQLVGRQRRDRARVERAESPLQLERARERLLDGDLLVEREADEQRQRLLREQ